VGATTVGDLLREARLRHGLSQEDLGIRAGIAPEVVVDIENGGVSPTIETLTELLELTGEDLTLEVKARNTGIDRTLNQGNLMLSAEERVQRGLAFAEVVRQNRRGGAEDLGRPLQLGALLELLRSFDMEFVVIGSIAGLVHGSAYPTYDLDLAYSGSSGGLLAALDAAGVQRDTRPPSSGNDVLSFETEFGALDIIRRVPGVATFEQLRRDSSRELIAGVSVQVASLNHLIGMKRATGRRKDQLMVMEYIELADEIRHREGED
jgi:transcriptional regulator with XRE-family HTH domain